MAPNDPARLRLLIAALLFTFGVLCGGATGWRLAAASWRRKVLDLEIRLRVSETQKAREIAARAEIGQRAEVTIRGIATLRRTMRG
jgi:hypothetical protein